MWFEIKQLLAPTLEKITGTAHEGRDGKKIREGALTLICFECTYSSARVF